MTWICLHGGGRYEFSCSTAIEPDPSKLEAVAHALSQLCRFTGHTPYPYSVAEHSVLAARHWGTTREQKLALLLHDAHEAFFGDINSPLKTHLFREGSPVRDVEDACAYRTLRLLGVQPAIMTQHAELIRKADMGMLRAEQEVFFPAVPLHTLPAESPESRAVAGVLRKRQGYLRSAHHQLQLAFEGTEAAVIAEHASPLPVPREQIRFGWPAKAEFLAEFARWS